MTQEHPITPPEELVQQWFEESQKDGTQWVDDVATQAARWGADMELEAVLMWLRAHHFRFTNDVYAARRSKPPSLKELSLKHLDVMERDGHYLPEIIADLRRAVQSLPS